MNEHAKPESPGANNHGNGNSRTAGFGDAPRFTVDKKKWPKNEAVAGPFTVRDLTVFGSTLLLFVASLVPMFALGLNLWNLGNLFFLGLGVALPLAVCALFVARRLSPRTRVRVGSLSVDQFASVVASFTLAFFFLAVASAFVPFLLVALLGSLGLFAATVLARLIPFFAGDFLGRAETPAHVAARHTAVPAAQPKRAKPAGQPREGGSAKDASAKGSGAGAAAESVSAGLSAGIDKVSDKVSGWARRLGSSEHKPESAEKESQPGQSAAQRPAGTGTPAAAPAAAPAATPAAAPASVATSASAGAAGASASPAATETRVDTTPGGNAQAKQPAASQPSSAQSGSAQPGSAQSSSAQPGSAQPAAAPSGAAPGAAPTEQTQGAPAPSTSGDARTAVHPQVRREEPIGATVDPASRPDTDGHPAHEAFWFAVAQPRTAVDERTGAPVFVIEPGGWVLALEDRGSEFLVQNTDGKVGVLRELNNIERG